MKINVSDIDALIEYAEESIAAAQSGKWKSKDGSDTSSKGSGNSGLSASLAEMLARSRRNEEVDETKIISYSRDKIDLSLMDIDPTADELVDRIKQIRAKPKHQQPKAITCLFHGPPGTGKSTLAKVIADKLGMKAALHSYGAIQSKYVGEGEANLRKIFKRAQRDNAVLILDECDALMMNRETASKEWHKSMTNQFLTELDEFQGIFIATTNFLDALDAACLRRLFLKMEFDWMRNETKLKAFNSIFGKRLRKVPAGLLDIDFLTLGDFKAVKERALYEPNVATVDDYVRLLREEVAYKHKTMSSVMEASKNPMGFGR